MAAHNFSQEVFNGRRVRFNSVAPPAGAEISLTRQLLSHSYEGTNRPWPYENLPCRSNYGGYLKGECKSRLHTLLHVISRYRACA